jgi:hypothetical protein
MEVAEYRIPGEYRLLNGREAGAALRREIIRHIERHGWDRVYTIDFSAVEFLDFSGADELVRGLLDELLAREGGARRVVLRAASPPVRENIAAVLELRKSVCLVEIGGVVEPLGPLSAPLRETLDLVIRNKRATARDIADHFHVAINTASNRLASLAEQGLVLRAGKRPVSGGGEENLFESLV